MADITMCAKENCPNKESCYRATAHASQYQSWSDFLSCNKENNYSEYIPNYKSEEKYD